MTGEKNTMLLPVTNEQIERWQDGELIQNVFPHLSPSEREFLISGVTPEEWDVVNEDMEEVYGDD
tara:strand:+ start:12333 stop:12527 length:195 start_codon:yes stop_codon:yes gene_type:complete